MGNTSDDAQHTNEGLFIQACPTRIGDVKHGHPCQDLEGPESAR